VIHFAFNKVVLLYRVETRRIGPEHRMKTMRSPSQYKISPACQRVRAAKIHAFMSAAFGHSK
jgi:hypothetical protein